jgi:beta-mannosidase
MIHQLTGPWHLRQAHSSDVLKEAAAADGWLDATVPGCVHLDLLGAGRIPDPFYGFNDVEVQWVADADWLYRRSFECPAELRELRRVDLVCRGLDTFARVFLNGREVGSADNMFVEWRWDLTALLEDGRNELLVLFESPRKVGRSRRQQDPAPPELPLFGPHRIYTRKAQYASGWDWGPDLNTSGIWRPIFLEGYDAGRISDVCARVEWADPDRPSVKVAVEVEALSPGAAELRLGLVGTDWEGAANAAGDLTAGTNTLQAEIAVDNPQLWWPAGAGPQNLYELRVSGILGGEGLAPVSTSIGLRRVALRREKDEEGETFIICINDEPVFCKGADWVPADSFLPRLRRGDYEELLGKAADAHMNMLRVWGGGIYEDDAFYDACDRLGIMVWQDFMFACAPYPDHLDWFCQSVQAEAACNVRRLRNHPSLVLWCGNNENQMIYERDGRLAGNRLYQETLPALCAELDPTRPYWPGSPFGGAEPNSPNEGNQHCWLTWHWWAHPDVLRRYNGRFITEFGVQAPPALETVRKYIPSGGHSMTSRLMEHHNRDGAGTEKLYRYLAAEFNVPSDFADTVYLMQIAQAEIVKTGVEHWRSRKFRTAGALFWQFNDCWPATSWSCLDYERRPKALYHYARRFFAPVLPVIDRRDGRFTVTVVNDRPDPFEGELVCGCGLLTGDQDWVHRDGVRVGPNAALAVQAKPEEELELSEPERRYFWCRLLEDGAEIARNTWLLLPLKHMQLTSPEWEIEAEKIAPRAFAVSLAAGCFAKGVRLRVDGVEAEFSDNFFDALPELPARVVMKTELDLEGEELARRLRVRSVADTRQPEA